MNNPYSVNAMQMWLRFDTNRSKVLTHDEIKDMVETVLGSTPSFEFMEELYTQWDLPDRKIDFKKWNELIPMKSDERQLRKRFRDIESDALIKKQHKAANVESTDRNAWAKDLLKNTYKTTEPVKRPTPQGPQGIFYDQWGNEFKLEGRTIHGLEHFDGMRIEPNSSLVLIQKGKEFRAIFDDNEIVWEDGDVWKKKADETVEVDTNRHPPMRNTPNPVLDGEYQDQFGNRFTVENAVVMGIDDFEALELEEGGMIYLSQAGNRYKGKFDPSFGINWYDGDIWKKDPPGSAPATIEMVVQTNPVVQNEPQQTKKPTLTDLQGAYRDQYGNEFVVDGTRIHGLDGFERMSANPRGLVVFQSGHEYRATFDYNHIQWADGDVWTKTDSVSVLDMTGTYVDQYNNIFRTHGNDISGLEGFEGMSVSPDGRIELQQKGATYGGSFDEFQIIWDDNDVWKKSQAMIQGFDIGEYELQHAAAITSSFQKDSTVEKEIQAGEHVNIEIIVLVDDRIRGKISGNGWISMHSPEHDYTWVQRAGDAGKRTAGGPDPEPRPNMYSAETATSGVWEKDDGTGVHTDSFVDFKLTPDAFRFYLIFALACFFSVCAIFTVLTVDNWDWSNNTVEKELGFNTFSLMYQYEPLTTFIAPPLYCIVVIFAFMYIVFQWIRTLMLRRLGYISVCAIQMYSFACIIELACFIFYAMAFSVPPERDMVWHTIPLIVFQLGLSLTGWKNYYYYRATGGNAKKTRNTLTLTLYCIAVAGWSCVAIWNTINMASRLNDKKAPLPLEQTMQTVWAIALGGFMLLGCGLGDSTETFEIRINLLKSR